MVRRQLVGFGLCVALVGSQPACAHRQLTNQQFALIVVYVGLVAAAIALSAPTPTTILPEPMIR
jgi:hypothetical protein